MNRKTARALICIVAFWFTFVHEGRAEKPAHVVAILRCPGSTAEDLREQLHILSHRLPLGEVKDGSATLYFESSLPDVIELMNAVSRVFPEDLAVERIYQEVGEVPQPSVPIPVKSTVVSIERELTKNLGLTIGEIARRISELHDKEQFDEFVEGKMEVSMVAPGGRKIPLRSLIRMRVIEVKRPLIISSKEKD